MSVVVVIPWRGGCQFREAALRWVLARYAGQNPDWDVVCSEPPAGPWIKAHAVMNGVRATDAEIVVVADADVWCDRTADAVGLVENGAGWAMPHAEVHRLTEEGTRALISGARWENQRLLQPPYLGFWGGGIVVARRRVLLDVPMDHRFLGWGQEDESWAVAMTTLRGEAVRLHHPLVHLFHPPPPRASRRWGSEASKALRRRYQAAMGSPDLMNRLLDEVRCDIRAAPEPSDHDLPPLHLAESG